MVLLLLYYNYNIQLLYIQNSRQPCQHTISILSSLPRPSSTSETKSIKLAPSRQQTYCAPETSSAAMQNAALYGSWPLNLNQYAWSPEALQQYQNMLLTDPTLQPQMHQPPTHSPLQPQPMLHTPHSTPPATQASSTPPPPPPPPPPSFPPPSAPVTTSSPHPPAAYSQPTPQPANLPHRTPSTAPTPSTWKPDSQHYDSNPLHGNPLFRQIQPTAWSRARNVHGMDPLLLPAASLLRQGQEDYSLRLLSAGRYMGLIPTRNIAESVLMSMLLKNMREKNLFIDDMAQSLHELAGQPVPSKKDQAIQYMQPLVDSIVTHLQSIQPPQVKAQQLHQIHQLQAQLAKQTEKLRTHGIAPTPEKTQRRHSKTTRASTNPSAPSHSAPPPPPPTPPSPDYLPETPSPTPALHSSPPTPGAPTAPTPRPAQKATTKAAPRKRQASLQPTPPSQSTLPFSKRPRHASPPASIPAPSPSPSPSTHPSTTEAPNSAATSMPSQTLLTQHPELATTIQPTKPLSADALPTAYSATKIQKWIAQHNNPELTEHVREITAILAKIPKKEQPNLAETAVRFGLPMAGATSMTYKTLSQFCAAASHLAAWLAHLLYTTQLPTSQHQQLHKDIHTTARCLEHLIHHHPAIDKHHLIFTHGLLHLTCIFHFANTSQRHQQWKQFFLQHHITPDSYTLSRTQQTPAVYIKLPFHHLSHRTYHQTGHYYIGSTNIGIYKREFNRQAKLKQLKEHKTPHVELALRWWHTNHNYQQYSTLFLLSTTNYTQAWAQEHALIQQHRSPLNFPYIQQHLHRTAFAFHIKPNKLHFSRTHTALRLWRRVRRATRSLHRNQTPTEQQVQSWTTLYHLASFNRQRFETSKRLRSGATTNWDVYALWRLAQHVEQPERSRCLSELRNILHFRNCSTPKGNKPLTLPFLSHPTFPTQVKHWLRKHIVAHKDLAIPLHLATHRPREQAHLSLNSILHNFRQWDNILPADLPPCNCTNFLHQHPHAEHQSGHIATTLDTLTLPSHLQHYRHCNGLSTAFPTWARYKQQITHTFFQWLKHHGMPVQNTDHITNKLHIFLQQQWHQHKQYLATHTFFHVPEVFELKRIITDQFIIHHADHETARPRIFCPHLYLKAHLGRPKALHTTTRLTFGSKQHPPPHHSHMARPKVQMGNKHPLCFATRIRVLEAEETMGQRQNYNILPQQYTGPPAQGRSHRIGHNGQTNLAISTRQRIHTRAMEGSTQLHAHHLHHHSSQHDQRWPGRIFQQRSTWKTATQPPHPHPSMETETQSGHNHSRHHTSAGLLPFHPHRILPRQQAHTQPQSPSYSTHTRHRTPQLSIQRLSSSRTNLEADPRHGYRQSNITHPCQHTHHTTRSQLATSIPPTTASPPSSTWTLHLSSLCGQPHDHCTTTYLQQPPLPNPCTSRFLSTPHPARIGGRFTFPGFYPTPCQPLHHLQSTHFSLANTRRLLSRITPSHT